MKKNKHSIEKLFLEVTTNSMNVANYLKNNTNMFIQNHILEIIEKELDAINNDQNEYLQINKLDISIDNQSLIKDGVFNYEDIRNEIRIQLDQNIKKIIEESNSSNEQKTNTTFKEHQRLNKEQRKTNTLIYYLEKGELPWWISITNISISNQQDFFKVEDIYTKSNEYFSVRLVQIINTKYVQKRLINQFSNEHIALIISVLLPKKESNKSEKIQNNELIKLLNQTNQFQLKQLFWETIFNCITNKNYYSIVSFYNEHFSFVSEKIDFQKFINLLKDFIFLDNEEQKINLIYQEKVALNKENNNQNALNHAEINDESKHITFESSNQINNEIIAKNEIINSNQEDDFQENNVLESDSFYIQNAGLIVIHPFIKNFFKNCNALNEDNSINDKELAVHLLHYLATKQEYDYEYNMLFEKFLCGIPIHYPIKREVDIPDIYKNEAENLLQSVVSHWSALKSTSTDIVRTEFLQREGKLDLKQNNPKLYIQRKTQDILLDSIPWNIGIVKIPWFKKIIYTEW